MYFRYQQSLFLVYGAAIFLYSILIQFLSILFKRRVASNLVIRLMEEPSLSVVRKEVSDATANKDLNNATNSKLDEGVGKIA